MNLSRAAAILVTILIMHSQSQAATNDFQMQSILLPALHGGSRFVDIDKHGRADLIVLEPLENRLAIYRQSASGFPTNPSQTLTLPPLTAWVAAFDADPAPGMELLASAPAGIFYFRHSDDGFEAEPRLLIKAAQVLTNVDAPLYMSLPTNATLPTISAGEAVVYANTNGLGWRAGEPLPLRAQAATLYTDRNQWTVGPNSARRLQIQESFTAESAKTDTNAFENAAIKKLAADLNKSPAQHLQGTSRVDVNGDEVAAAHVGIAELMNIGKF